MCLGVRARTRVAGVLFATGIALGVALPAHADLLVPANSTFSLGTGGLDLACTDLIVAGTLQVNGGAITNVRNVTIQAGGVIDGGTGSIALGGNWSSDGILLGGTGRVQFRDICSLASATITGNTTFSTASFVSAIGKVYAFAIGSTQTVSSLLEISGTAGQPIQFRSSAAGQIANLNLLNSGTQQIQHVGVTDVWATGQWLAPVLTNEGGAGNASRWFGTPAAASRPIPALSASVLIALAALLALIGAFRLRRRSARADEARGSSRRTAP
jgi:hypothetical protein